MLCCTVRSYFQNSTLRDCLLHVCDDAGGANCVLGTFLMRDLLGMPWLIWLLPTVGSLGGLMLVGMLLEVPRMRRVREVRH